MAALNLLTTRRVCKSFGGLDALTDVDFELPRGQVRALIGPNGAGKSTFVGTVCGRIQPTSGAIVFDGQDITHMATHRRICLGIAYTFQITSVFSRLTAYENVALGVRRIHGNRWQKVHSLVMEALERVRIADLAEQLAGDLSYGHQRLLEIAMGLGQAPDLFILDEPTQGLAEGEIEGFKNLIRSLAGQTTILLIEHNMNVVMETAEFITVLNSGRVLAEGTVDEMRKDRDVQAAYLGRD